MTVSHKGLNEDLIDHPKASVLSIVNYTVIFKSKLGKNTGKQLYW